MNIPNRGDQEQVNWKQLIRNLIKIWDRFFKILVILMVLTYLAGKALGNWVHQTNDRLAANWVGLIVPQTPVMEEEENEEEEQEDTPLPATPSPTPLAIQDPWESPIEVELMLPLALEPLAILFTTPLMLAAAQAPVALLAAGKEAKKPVRQAPTPARTPRPKRKESTSIQAAPATNSHRKRGRRAHKNRARQTA